MLSLFSIHNTLPLKLFSLSSGLVLSAAFSLTPSDESEAANRVQPLRRMVLSALLSYGAVNRIVKQILPVNLSTEKQSGFQTEL